jgi:hypothetical protein
MQRLALMMAVMVLGMPQVHSCHASANPGMLWNGEMSEARVCPPIMLRGETDTSAMGEQLDPSHWRKLPAIHCQATQSVLSFTCGLDSRMGRVKFERFMEGIEDCSGSCRPQAGILNRKITQVLVEVLIEKEWIWWNEVAGKVATASGRTALVRKEGEAVMEDGLRVWTGPDKSCGCESPRRWGRPRDQQLSQDLQWEEHRSGSATPAVQRGSVLRRLFFATQQRIAIT